MPKLIPKNQILKSANYGYVLGDIAESFGIDIGSSFGSIRASLRMKLITKPTDMQVPLAFAYFGDKYYFCSDSYVYVGGNAPDDTFSKDTSSGAPTGIDTDAGNMAIFNNSLYVANGGDISKLVGSTWSTPITSELNGIATHLMKVFGNRLYITDNSDKIHSVDTSDVLVDTGQFSADWDLGAGWVPTFMDIAQGAIWIAYLNTNDGRGIILTWDGDTADTYTRRFDLENGAVAGCVLDNIPYIIDIQGRLKKYGGSSFVEVDRLFKKGNEAYLGVRDQTNTTERPIHPNGMIPTEDGNIMFLFKNGLAATSGGISSNYEDTLPSGIYEYNVTTGLTHRHSLSYTPIAGTTITDYGQQRINRVGALFYRQPNTSPFENGALLAGCQYFTDATTTEYGAFASDTFDTTQKYAYFETTKIFSDNIEDSWSKIYLVYKNLLNSDDKIVVKYKTVDNEETEATITWASTTSFTTTTDISSYVVGDEVQVIQGTGSGKSAHIATISEDGGTYTVTLDETFTGATGTAIALLDNWIRVGEITSDDDKQWNALTTGLKNSSPWVKIKITLQFTGKNELYKAKLINKTTVKE